MTLREYNREMMKDTMLPNTFKLTKGNEESIQYLMKELNCNEDELINLLISNAATTIYTEEIKKHIDA